MGIADDPRLEVTSRAAWRGWLESNHESATGVWAVTFRKGSGGPIIPYEELVEEALCFGWVDSRPGKLDERRTMLRFTPRRPGSGWSRPNRERVARLDRDGMLAPAGRAAIESAKADGSWSALEDYENLVVPDDLAAALAAAAGAEDEWAKFPPSYKRSVLESIGSAKRPATRAGRIEQTATLAARGERANEWRPKI